MVTLMNQGGFDLVTASGDASLRLIAGDTVQPVNVDLIPSWGTVDERLQNAPWHTVDGVHYGTPYQWGANVLMYNTETFPEAPTTWGVIYIEQELPDGQSNKGRVQAYDGPIALADAALYLMTHNPELGITDPYALTQEQYAATLELARGQRQLVSRYWHDVIAQMEDFKNEGVVASSAWPFQVNLLQAEGAPIASTIPRRAPPAGPTRRCCTPTPRTRTARICGWSTRSTRRCRATWPRGSARCLPCPRAARPASCSAPKAARSTASRTSTRSPSGAPPPPAAPTAATRACPTASG
jgi:hypothetical protein